MSIPRTKEILTSQQTSAAILYQTEKQTYNKLILILKSDIIPRHSRYFMADIFHYVNIRAYSMPHNSQTNLDTGVLTIRTGQSSQKPAASTKLVICQPQASKVYSHLSVKQSVCQSRTSKSRYQCHG